jgi:hypothetical protein
MHQEQNQSFHSSAVVIICLDEESRILSHRTTGGRRVEASAAVSESAISVRIAKAHAKLLCYFRTAKILIRFTCSER